MKTLVKANISLYLFKDEEIVFLSQEGITIGNPPKFIIADCNPSNTTLFEGVTAPDDWVGGKYLFNGGGWSLNPEWFEPEELVLSAEA